MDKIDDTNEKNIVTTDNQDGRNFYDFDEDATDAISGGNILVDNRNNYCTNENLCLLEQSITLIKVVSWI